MKMYVRLIRILKDLWLHCSAGAGPETGTSWEFTPRNENLWQLVYYVIVRKSPLVAVQSFKQPVDHSSSKLCNVRVPRIRQDSIYQTYFESNNKCR